MYGIPVHSVKPLSAMDAIILHFFCDDDSENCQAVLSLAASTDYQYRLQR